MVKKDEKFGLIALDRKTILEPKFTLCDKWHSVKADYVISTNKEKLKWIVIDGKSGFVDEKGKIFVEPKFNFVSDFTNGFAKVRLNGKFGLINTKRDFFIEPEFDKIEQLENIILISKNEKYGIVSFSGKILEPQFDSIQKSYSQKIFMVEKDSKIGLVDKEAQIIIEPKFDKVSSYNKMIFYR
ncbi:WG repeat-containing protein [Campylobacter lari]|nr:WG repeat-containing protein [Campylobacter lari]